VVEVNFAGIAAKFNFNYIEAFALMNLKQWMIQPHFSINLENLILILAFMMDDQYSGQKLQPTSMNSKQTWRHSRTNDPPLTIFFRRTEYVTPF
jgi:hypothetical protein